jgi:hypothetical protein
MRRTLRRLVHWMDRTAMGWVMSIAAFALERAVVRSTRRAGSTKPSASPTPSVKLGS